MSDLTALQTYFQKYLMKASIEDILPSIQSDALPAETRLKVYFDAYRLRLLDILQTDFSKTYTLLGEADFQLAFERYLEQYPSTHFSVRYFGRHFSQFLREHPAYQGYPVLSEMAAFEYALMDAIDAEDAEVATPQHLAQIPPEQWGDIQLIFHPSMRQIACLWNTPSLWKAIDDEAAPQAPRKNPEAIAWLIWRKEIRNLFQSLDPMQAELLLGFQQEKTFSDILEQLSDRIESDTLPLFAVQNMQHWLDSGLVSQVRLKK